MLAARPTCAPMLARTIADVIAPSPLSLRMMAARQRMHVACVRRAAAAYGNASGLIAGAVTLDFALLFAPRDLSSRLTWHDFVYVTMAPSVHHRSLVP